LANLAMILVIDSQIKKSRECSRMNSKTISIQ